MLHTTSSSAVPIEDQCIPRVSPGAPLSLVAERIHTKQIGNTLYSLILYSKHLTVNRFIICLLTVLLYAINFIIIKNGIINESG